MLLQIKVKPNAKQGRLESQLDGTWIAHVNAPPVDGKANARLIEMVADHFHVRKSDVAIERGASSRIKWIRIHSKP